MGSLAAPTPGPTLRAAGRLAGRAACPTWPDSRQASTMPAGRPWGGARSAPSRRRAVGEGSPTLEPPRFAARLRARGMLDAIVRPARVCMSVMSRESGHLARRADSRPTRPPRDPARFPPDPATTRPGRIPARPGHLATRPDSRPTRPPRDPAGFPPDPAAPPARPGQIPARRRLCTAVLRPRPEHTPSRPSTGPETRASVHEHRCCRPSRGAQPVRRQPWTIEQSA